MHRLDRLAIFLPVSSALMMVAGCGGGAGADSSRVEAKVSGLVKFHGKPVSDGEVIFYASNVDRQVGGATGKIGPDGTYSLTAFAGVNAVRFTGSFFGKDPSLQRKKRVVTVKAGENAGVDFDLGGEGDDAKGPNFPSRKDAKGAKFPPRR